MQSAPHHYTTEELEQHMSEILASPQDQGVVEAIYIRPARGERAARSQVQLSPEGGIVGDRWSVDHWQKLRDGRPNPRSQVSLMNVRVLRAVASDADAMPLAGDNLIVDLDLSQQNLPSGSQLQIGEVILEMSVTAHTGCSKFAQRFGGEARKFVNSPLGKALHLRGRYARILQGGTIRLGDEIRKI